MGGNCCVAAREKPLPASTAIEVSAGRNTRYSPSWSFRWDNRTHIEDIIDVPSRFSQNNSGNIGSDIKSGADTEAEAYSDGSSPVNAFPTPRRRKSPSCSGISRNSRVAAGDIFTGSSSLPEEKDSSSVIASASDKKPSLSICSSPISSVSTAEPASSRSCSLSTDLTKFRKTRCSPGRQLSRQVSDTRIPSLKSLNENSSPDDRQSFELSACSNDLLTVGSHGGSSDGWSMRMFSELVASSQKERWSFGSESPCFPSSKFAKSNAQASSSLCVDVQTCGICSKLLKDRSGGMRWPSNELAVVAILVCGHVYHAECLESVTSETAMYDPSCPVCNPGENFPYKLIAKNDSKAKNKISRIAVAGIDVDGGSIADHRKKGKAPKMGASSSMKSSFARPFLRRHFSIASPRPMRSVSESETTRKKGFWAKYRRE